MDASRTARPDRSRGEAEPAAAEAAEPKTGLPDGETPVAFRVETMPVPSPEISACSPCVVNRGGPCVDRDADD